MRKREQVIIVLSVLLLSILSSCAPKENEPENKFEQFMNAFQEYSSYPFSGTIYIGKEGVVLYNQALGYANYQDSTEMSLSTQFPIGSITKSITAIAILQLQEQGLLSVNDLVASHIDGFDETITIHHLLTHTSGIQRDGMFLGRDPVPLEDNVAFIMSKSRLFTVGEKFSYSNAGYNILAAIIENVSKLTYNEYIQQHIFDPLNMNDSYGGFDANYNSNQAIGYRFDKGNPLKLDIYNLSSVIGSGNVYSTVEDMNKYIQSIKANTLINNQSVSLMLTPHWQEEGFNYGYGWEINNNEVTWVRHMGNIGNSGYVSSVYFSMNPDINMVFLTNNDNTTALDVVSKSMEAIVLDQPYVVFKKPIETSLTDEEISSFVGTYMLDVGVQIRVRYESGTLYATSETDDFYELIAIGDNKFHYKDLQWITLEFVIENEVQKIIIQNINNIFEGSKQ